MSIYDTESKRKEKEAKVRKYTKIFLFSFTFPIFLFGIYMISPVMTGNVIGELGAGESSLIGIILIVVAILGFYFYSKIISDYF